MLKQVARLPNFSSVPTTPIVCSKRILSWNWGISMKFSTADGSIESATSTTPTTPTSEVKPTWKILEEKLLEQIPKDRLPKMLSPHPTKRYVTLKRLIEQIDVEKQREAKRIVYPTLELPAEKKLMVKPERRNHVLFPSFTVKIQRGGFEDHGKFQKFTVRVRPNMGKMDLKAYFEQIYGFKVLKINTVNYEPKKKKIPGRGKVTVEVGYKKAIITIEPTQEGFKVDPKTGKPLFAAQLEQQKKQQEKEKQQ